MTTGNRTSGTTNLNFYNGWRKRVWSGGDSPKADFHRERIDVSYTESFLRVRKGKKYIVIKYHNRFLSRPVRPPKRSYRTFNNYSVVFDVRDYPVGNSYWDPNWNVYQPFDPNGWGLSNPVRSFFWDANDDIALIGKLREKVAGSDFNLGVFLGEGKEALGMIANAATRVASAYEAARKGNLRKARKLLVNGTTRETLGRKTLANNWLELQYGWLPLLKDAESGAQFLAHQLSAPLVHKVTARSGRKAGSITTGSPTNASYTGKDAFSTGQLIAYLSEVDTIALSGLTDPSSVAWELLPYSFVIDWFIPIGNYLSARGLAQSLTGTFVTTRKDVAYAGCWMSNGAKLGSPPVGSNSYLSLQRSVNSTLQVPTPCIKPLSSVLSWRHAANAVALLTNLRT